MKILSSHTTRSKLILSQFLSQKTRNQNITAFHNWSGVFPNEGIVVTHEVLEELYEDLPRHYDALLGALEKIGSGVVK